MSSKIDQRIALRSSLRLTLRFMLVLAVAGMVIVIADWLLFRDMLLSGCRRMSEDGTALTLAEVRGIARHTFWTNIPVVLGVVLLLGAGVAFFVTYQWMSRLRAVIRTIQDVTKTGDFHRRVQIDDRGPAPGADLFNAMLEMGDGMMRRMRESLDNVAHELRTPLTRLRAGAERALTHASDPNVCHGALSDALEESENLLQVVDTLLDIAEAETGVMRLRKEAVAIEDVVRSVVDLYEYVAEDEGVRLEVDVESGLRAHADPDRLRQVLANLVDNALKYGADGGEVRLQAARLGAQVRIRVSDRGAGIAPDEVEKIWKRLYRSGSSRRGPKKGLGLGLSFAKAIVEAHGGRISVDSTVGQGTTFTVELPSVAREDPSF